MMREECGRHGDGAGANAAFDPAAAALAAEGAAAAAAAGQPEEAAPRTDGFAYASNIGRRGLRCVNV